ncbi:MAG: hypothetical protein IJT79_08345 [Ruminococcus sp.]|nr:hypothetical protein [Ruminococcus sp.]
MMDDLFYNGKNLRSLGFMIKERPFYKSAERNQELSDVLGADGAALLDNGGFKNVELQYKVNSNPFWCNDKTDEQLFRQLTSWLYAEPGEYKILRDTYNPGYFTHAVPISPEQFNNPFKHVLDGTLTFSRKPFWYSDLGQKKLTYNFDTSTAVLEINNPEPYYAMPYIKVTTGSAFSITTNGDTSKIFKVNGVVSFVEIDCEEMNVYAGSTDFNDSTEGDYLPILKPGRNTLLFESLLDMPFTVIEIIPRWRRL